MKSSIIHLFKTPIHLVLFVFIFAFFVPQVAHATVYQPGETLEPDCAPGAVNCGVATYPSTLGTSTPIENSLLTIQATSTNSILSTLRAFAGQLANLFQVQNSAGSNVFSINASGDVTLGSLNGPLQANNGLVSATSSLGVAYGGTGLTALPSYGNILVGNSSGGYTLTSTSSLGLSGNAGTVTSIAFTVPTGLSVIGSPITTSGTIALSLTAGYAIPLTASTTEYDVAYSNRITSVAGPLSISNHALSLSTTGDWTGTLDGQEGSYYLNAGNLSDFGVPLYGYFSATTTNALAEGSSNLYFTNARADSRFATDLAATTTTALAEGTNLYFTNTRSDNRFITDLAATSSVSSITTLGNLVSTGALTSGSIGSGFGNVNIGSNIFTGDGSGLTNLNANNLTNFGVPFYTYLSATTTNALAEGSSNLYWTNTRFDNRLSSTTSLPNITTLSNLSLSSTQLTNFGTPFYSLFSATTTDALSEGLTNLYFTNTRADNRFITDLAATSSVSSITTLGNLVSTGALTSGSIGSGFGNVNIGANTFTGNGSGLTSLNASNLTNFGVPFYTYFSATTTDALTQGLTNKYYNDSFVQSFIHASSTIPKIYTANTFVAANTFNGGLTIDSLNGPLQANNGLVSATSSIGVKYGGTGLTSLPAFGQILRGTGTGYALVATSTLGIDLTDTAGTLTVGRGGTGVTSFNQGWLFSVGDGTALSASSSPTVNYITATSTLVTSTFANGINITGGCFAKNGVCIPQTGSDLQYVTSYKTNDTFSNITSATTTLTTVTITPTTATGDVVVRSGITFTSSNNTDQPVSIAIRQTNCTGTTLQSTLYTVASAAGSSQFQSINITHVAVDPGSSAQTYALCISASAGDTDVSGWDMSAVVIDTGADLAELYSTQDVTLEAGDLVSLDPNLEAGVQKSTNAHDQHVLGIVSTRPGMVIGGLSKQGVKALPIALSGRVPVKVTTENGPIVSGDYLTPSSVPGVAMKATGMGPIIGQALSPYHGEGVGIVLAFVKNFDFGDSSVLLGDTSPQVKIDGSDNGLATLITATQAEPVHDPVAIIQDKITKGTKFLTDFVSARVTALRGYFDEVFAKKIHAESVCVKKSDGTEVCVSGDQVETILKNNNVTPPVLAAPAAPPASVPTPTPEQPPVVSDATEPVQDVPVVSPEVTPSGVETPPAPVVSDAATPDISQ